MQNANLTLGSTYSSAQPKPKLRYRRQNKQRKTGFKVEDATSHSTQLQKRCSYHQLSLSVDSPPFRTTLIHDAIYLDDANISEAHSSPMLASRANSSKSATPSPVAPSSRRGTGSISSQEWQSNDDDIDRLVAMHHQTRSSLSSLGVSSAALEDLRIGYNRGHPPQPLYGNGAGLAVVGNPPEKSNTGFVVTDVGVVRRCGRIRWRASIRGREREDTER